MPRLIDADNFLDLFYVASAGQDKAFINAVEMVLDDTPTIGDEPVVRCKDCKHWGTGYGGETDYAKVCEFAGWMVGANGYCVYGEKMDLEVQDEN